MFSHTYSFAENMQKAGGVSFSNIKTARLV